MNKDFFPPRPSVSPKIYAYELIGVPDHKGLLKIGYTTRTSQDRIAEQLKTSGLQYKILFEDSAMRSDGSIFTDHEIHRYLISKGIKNISGEWFRCTIEQLKNAHLCVKTGIEIEEIRTQTFGMRPEQEEAVEKTSDYFSSFKKENHNKIPHFLWNAKMRFGKTFASYQLAKKNELEENFSFNF